MYFQAFRLRGDEGFNGQEGVYRFCLGDVVGSLERDRESYVVEDSSSVREASSRLEAGVAFDGVLWSLRGDEASAVRLSTIVSEP